MTTYQIDEKINEFENELESILEERDIEILDYPEISHRTVVKRIYSKKKPFKKDSNRGFSENGYKDFLIWKTVLSVLSDGEENVAFITGNTKDFFKEDSLHPHLIDDLNNDQVDEGKINLYESLEKFNETKVLPKLEKLDDIVSQLNEGEFEWLDIEQWAKEYIPDYLFNDFFDGVAKGIHGGYGHHSVRLDEEDIKSIHTNDVRKLRSGNLLISIIVLIDTDLNVTMDYEEYIEGMRAGSEEVREFVGEMIGNKFSFIDGDVPIEVEAEFDLIFDKSGEGVTDFELKWLG